MVLDLYNIPDLELVLKVLESMTEFKELVVLLSVDLDISAPSSEVSTQVIVVYMGLNVT